MNDPRIQDRETRFKFIHPLHVLRVSQRRKNRPTIYQPCIPAVLIRNRTLSITGLDSLPNVTPEMFEHLSEFEMF